MLRTGITRLSSSAPQSRMKSLWKVISPERNHLLGAVVAVGATSAGTLSFPHFAGKLMDGFAQSSTVSPDMWLELVYSNTWACVGALTLVGMGGFTRAYLLETASEKISRRLRMNLFKSLLEKPQTFYDSARTGELVSRLGGDITRVSRSIMDGAFGFRVLINAGAGTMLVAKSVPLAVVPQLLAPVGLMFVGGVMYGRFVKRISRKQTEALAHSTQIAEENLSLIKIVKLLNGENKAIVNYQNSLNDVYSLAQKNALASGGKVAAFVTIGGGFLVHVIYNCGMLISSGALTIGQTSALAGYMLVCGNSYQGLISAYGEIQKALGACDRVIQLIETESSAGKYKNLNSSLNPANKALNTVTPPVIFTTQSSAPSIKFENVHFGYGVEGQPGFSKILNGLNLFVPSAAKQAIVGLSGSGKSSVLMLLARLYDPLSGRIMLNDTDISTIHPSILRSEVLSIVPQESALFNDSIRNNIWYPAVSTDNALSSLESQLTAQARLDFVSDWNANVGERGQNLSGGERQRVTIARAMAKQKHLLLLDEATSALDPQSDQIILNQLKMLKDTTILAVTHRMSAIEWSDRITVISKNGTVAQEGDTHNVMRNPCAELRTLLSQIDKYSSETVV